jgi:hypothetical protein
VPVVHAQRALFAGRKADRDHHVQVQTREVDQIVAAQRLVTQVSMDESQASKPASPGTETAHVRQHELGRVAHDDVVHGPAAVDEHADLSPGRVRHAHERPRELRGRESIQRHLAPVDAL